MQSRILFKYVYKTYYELLHDSEFLLLLSRYGWVQPAVIPRAYYLFTNLLIRKYLTIGEIPLINDIQFQRILCRAGFYGPACTTTSSTTTTTTTMFNPQNEFLLGSNIGTICLQPSGFLYYSGTFGPGIHLFTDQAMTIPVTGSTLVADNNVGSPTAGQVFNLDSGTGVVGSFTGTTCDL